jgi:hypothetical protein
MIKGIKIAEFDEREKRRNAKCGTPNAERSVVVSAAAGAGDALL